MTVSTYTGAMAPELDDYITTSEAAEMLNVHPSRIRVLIKEGRLEARKVGPIWMIERESVEDFERLKPWEATKDD